MAAQKKYKKMTNKEKQFRKELREKLREDGLLPPPKPPLNRKKFIEETRKLYFDELNYGFESYIMQALSYMLNHHDNKFKTSLEAVGAAKVIQIAFKLKEFQKMKKNMGETTYTILEEFNYIEDIYKA